MIALALALIYLVAAGGALCRWLQDARCVRCASPLTVLILHAGDHARRFCRVCGHDGIIGAA